MNEWIDERSPKLYLTLSEDNKTWNMHLQAIHINRVLKYLSGCFLKPFMNFIFDTHL